MARTTFSGPLRVGVARDNTISYVQSAQMHSYTFADTGSFAITVTIPADSMITSISNTVTTAWNSGTSDALEIGTLADPDAYADVASLQVAGASTVVVDATQATAQTNIGTTDVTVYLTINSAGAAATAGAAIITVHYLQAINATP